jgi:hypothetical protein
MAPHKVAINAPIWQFNSDFALFVFFVVGEFFCAFCAFCGYYFLFVAATSLRELPRPRPHHHGFGITACYRKPYYPLRVEASLRAVHGSPTLPAANKTGGRA